MKIVFAILNKNQGNRLKECLDSLFNQSYKDFILIVVDGGSTDGSIELLEKYKLNNDSFFYFVQQGKGIGSARNQLLDYLDKYFKDTEIIFWGDAEQIYDVDYVKNMLKKINADVIGGKNIIASKSSLGQSLWWLYSGIDGKGILGHSIMVKRKLYTQQGTRYPETVAMDDYFLYSRWTSEGIKFAHNPTAICYVRTVETFRDFIDWHRRKIKSILKGFSKSYTPCEPLSCLRLALKTPNIKLFILFNLVEVSLIFTFTIAKASFVFLIPLFAGLLMFLSFYLWIKGRNYVLNLKLKTILLMGPLFQYHYWVAMIASLSSFIISKLKSCLKNKLFQY